MADWTVCSQCQLKHTRRADGLCPRCKASTEDGGGFEPPAPVAASSAPEPGGAMPAVYDGRPFVGGGAASTHTPVAAEDSLPMSARLAGAALVANGLIVLAERSLIPQSGFFASPVSMLIDLGIGVLLISGSRRLLGLAVFRVIAGGVILPFVHLVQGNPAGAVLQVILSVSIALLLVGRAGAARVAIGAAGLSLCLGLELVGLRAAATGRNPLGRWMMAGQIEGAPVTVVDGQAARYRIVAPGTRWYSRRASVVKRDNPLADRWIVRPEYDAHVLVIAEVLPAGARIDMDRLTEVVVANARQSAKNFVVVEQSPLSPHVPSRLLHTRGTMNDMEIEMYFGLYVREPHVFQVMAFSGKRQFGAVGGELRQILDSFQIL